MSNFAVFRSPGRPLAALFFLAVFAWQASSASAMPADIRIHGTAPEGYVNIRSAPNTSGAPIGRIPEGASPDYECFTYGESIGGVPVWFLVNYGARGYYASYYDDSSYRTDAELTGKYGIPKCGAAPAAGQSTQPPPTPANGSIFYAGDTGGTGDGYGYVRSASVKRYKREWYRSGCSANVTPGNYGDVIDGRRITTLAGFSSGRLGTLYYLRNSPSRGANVTRIVIFDPGNQSDLSGPCDRNASATLADWLRRVPSGKLIILAGKRTAESRHKGIQDVYFAPRIRGTSLAQRVIVCNLNGWSHADVIKGYQHFIGSPPDRCPSEYRQWTP